MIVTVLSKGARLVTRAAELARNDPGTNDRSCGSHDGVVGEKAICKLIQPLQQGRPSC